jgi:hypothetical protein
MVIIERDVQHIYPDKWAELESLDKEYNVIESKYGFPNKRRLTLVTGADELQTLIIERQWESLAAMEAAFEKLLADPAYQALVLKGAHVLRDVRMELYQPLP